MTGGWGEVIKHQSHILIICKVGHFRDDWDIKALSLLMVSFITRLTD